jgi:hypothetical protein
MVAACRVGCCGRHRHAGGPPSHDTLRLLITPSPCDDTFPPHRPRSRPWNARWTRRGGRLGAAGTRPPGLCCSTASRPHPWPPPRTYTQRTTAPLRWGGVGVAFRVWALHECMSVGLYVDSRLPPVHGQQVQLLLHTGHSQHHGNMQRDVGCLLKTRKAVTQAQQQRQSPAEFSIGG